MLNKTIYEAYEILNIQFSFCYVDYDVSSYVIDVAENVDHETRA